MTQKRSILMRISRDPFFSTTVQISGKVLFKPVYFELLNMFFSSFFRKNGNMLSYINTSFSLRISMIVYRYCSYL